MNRVQQRVALLLAGAVFLAGCDGFFAANVFAGIERDIDVISLLSEESLDDLATSLQSEDTFDQLSDAEVRQIEDFLDEVIAETADDQTKAVAATALASLRQNTTLAGEAVRSVSALLETFLAEEPPAMDDIIRALVPADALADEESFGDLLSAFSDLEATYGVVNGALADPTVTVPDPGTVFQAALVAHIVSETIAAMDLNGNGIDDDVTADKVEILYGALTGVESDGAV